MKNYLNKSVFKGIKSELEEKYGVDKSDEIWRYADSEYHKLETGEPDPDKTSRSYVFPAVSIYRASSTKEMLDDMHKRKIDMADSIYVINVDGYIGESTKSEIAYAIKHGKEVRYLVEPGTEPKHYLFIIRDYLKQQHIEYNADAIFCIEERNKGKLFAKRDHIKAMIYALLTNQTVWSRIQPLLPWKDYRRHC